jgi:hypothetical protein
MQLIPFNANLKTQHLIAGKRSFVHFNKPVERQCFPNNDSATMRARKGAMRFFYERTKGAAGRARRRFFSTVS